MVVFRLLLVKSRVVADVLFGVMSRSFLFGVPFVLGFIQVYVSEKYFRRRWWERVIMPWVPALMCLVASLFLAWEGIICVVLFAPLMMLMASLGGVAAGVTRDIVRPDSTNFVFTLCLMLPIAISPLERLPAPSPQLRVVATQIEIAATPDTIWGQIKRVPPIGPAELADTWTRRIGFPRPVEATLSHEGIGGVRRATFEGGVLFFETIIHWEPQRHLAFSIRADTASIPAATLDEHVRIGGPYFDVLQGEYEIEPAGNNTSILHLSSGHRLSTRFNTYAGLWSDAIMRDIQHNILLVIKHRSERQLP